MILSRILSMYESEPDLLRLRRAATGNPTASAVGNCLAQLTMLRFPKLTNPEMRPIRTAWVFQDGHRQAEELKAMIERAYPGLGGLGEELFYFGVPVTEAQEMALAAKIADGSLWGTVRHRFVPPRVELGAEGGLARTRLAERDPNDPSRPRRMGFIVDPGSSMFWCPLYIDHMLKHPDHGLVLVEFKAMSRFGFRRAMMGDLEWRIQMQMAMMLDATGLDHGLIFIQCKDTCHKLELAFLRGQEKTRVTLTKTNGQQETFLVPRPGLAVDLEGRPVDLQENETWDVGEVWTPWDPALLEQARRRVLDVLLFEPAGDKAWMREFGPSFLCETCSGTGTQVIRKNSTEPLKKPKPCVDCNATGQLEEAVLPWACSYCATVRHCYGPAKARLEIGTKPEWIIRRADYEASGLTFTPRGAEPIPSTVGMENSQ